MTFRVLLLSVVFAGSAAPALADDGLPGGRVPMRARAPADEYFGHARMSVLGISNVIRDVGKRIDEGTPPRSMIDGPLSFVGDAIRDWQHEYPRDPWIARDLYALELVYVRVPTSESQTLARATEGWLERDYPDSPLVDDARIALGDTPGDEVMPDAWGRFSDLRAPLPTTPH